jgi:16S rRNA (cytosine967-C5)-methyltransferase
MDCRAAAATVLDQVIRSGTALDEPLANGLESIKPRDHALFQQLCYGTLRHYYRLSGILEQALARPIKARDGDIRALLLLGLHQLYDLRIPDHAAIATTVDASRALGKPWASGLVNAVLRRCSRERDQLESRLSRGALLDHPDWLINALQQAWPSHWQGIISAGNEHPPMFLRVNQRRTGRDAYLATLTDAGIAAQALEGTESGILLTTPRKVEEIPGFAEGLASVQDKAAQHAAPLLRLAEGQRVLDACGAPGGKTCHILELCPDIDLVSLDVDPLRLERVSENLSRLGLSATLCADDARSPDGELAARRFDRILVDAPCSGTGVIRRHPDIKLLRREDDIRRFGELQQQILAGLWPLLRPGGELLYVTCSVLPAENSELVERFLKHTPDAEPLPLETSWGLAAGTGRQILPEVGGPDGLFFARLRKRESDAACA